MPSLIDIRPAGSRAVKSTQQITKALKDGRGPPTCAGRRSGSSTRRPMARQISRVLGDLATRVDPSTHPLLAQAAEGDRRRVLMVVLTADQGNVRQLQRQTSFARFRTISWRTATGT